MGCPAVAAGGPSCALWGAAVESPHLFPPSRSNGVPVPRHGDSRGLPRGTLTGTRTRRLQHLPGCAAATAHPHLRRVSTRAAAGTACLGVGGSFAAASLRFCCHQRRHRASGTGCSSPSACLASGSVKPPPRLLLLGMTHVLTSLLCPKAQTVIPAALVGLIEILSLPAYTATLVSGTAMARCGRSVAPSGDHALDFSILVAPPALGYALCLSPCPCQESQPGTCPRAAWTATPGSSSPSSTGFTPVPLGQ